MINIFKKRIEIFAIFIAIFVVGCITAPKETVVLEIEPREAPAYPANNLDNYSVDDSWVLDWYDEFDDGVFDNNVWDRQVLLFPYNNEFQKYTGKEDTAYEKDGYMILKADWDGKSHGKGHYTSARVISNPGGYTGKSDTDGKLMKFGKIAARIQLPYGKGVWPAFWMLGDNISETGGNTPWPSSGEIDILESGYKDNPDGYYGSATVGGAFHYDTSIDNKKKAWNYFHGKKKLDVGIYAEQFHVFELEWDELYMTLKIDGVEYFTKDITDPSFNEFREDFYMIFNIAIGGNLTDTPDNENTVFPQYMYIDWVRHYTRN